MDLGLVAYFSSTLYIDTYTWFTPSGMNFQTILMPKVILAKNLLQKMLVSWIQSYLKCAFTPSAQLTSVVRNAQNSSFSFETTKKLYCIFLRTSSKWGPIWNSLFLLVQGQIVSTAPVVIKDTWYVLEWK